MRKLILTVLFFGLLSLGYSQNDNASFVFVKAGVSSNSIKDNGLDENTISPYLGIGANLGKGLSFQPELLFSFYKLDISNTGFSGASSESYTYNGGVTKISLPLLAKYTIAGKFGVLVGITPSSIFINKKKSIVNKTIEGIIHPESTFENTLTFTGTISIGASYKINNKIFAEVRYDLAPKFLASKDFLADQDKTVIYNSNVFKLREKRSIQIGLGYKLF